MTESKRSVPEFELPTGTFTFLTTGQESFTYQQLLTFSDRLAERCRPLRQSADRPLLIVADNSPETVFVIAACFLQNIPVLPVHADITRREMETALETTGPFAVVTPREGPPPVELPGISVDTIQTDTASQEGQVTLPFENPEKIAGYFLTSGSTGTPKVVPVKRRQVLFAASASAKNFKPSPNKYWLLCLPLHHIGGVSVIYRSVLYQSAVYLVPSFDEKEIRDLLDENKSFEVASMVPTMLERLLENTFFRVQFNFKAVLVGGGPVSLDLINRALTRGIPIVTSYGMTETCAQIAANPMLQPSGMYIPKKSVGPVFEPNEIEIRDDQNKPLLFNESGHIWLKGPQVFDGYPDPAQTRDHFDENGWFNTGDFGHINRKGQLFVESRRDDLIITGGENVSPSEIEEHLLDFPFIRDAAVVGIPDKKWGQRVTAFVVVEPDHNFDEEALKQTLKESLQSYKVPKEIHPVADLPKTSTLKIKRAELVEQYREFTGSS